MIEDPDWLETMAVPETVTSWAPETFVLTGQMKLETSLWCIPRNVYEAVGGYVYDEEFNGGYGFLDDDFLARARIAGFTIAVKPVRAQHLQGQTFRSYYDQEEFRRRYDRNMEIFKKKWDHAKPPGGWLR